MRYRFISSLEKYRPDNPAANIPDCPEEYVAQGGICAVQLLLFADSSGWASIVGECKAGAVSIRTVEPVPVRHPIVPDGVEKSLHGWGAWPDVLMPRQPDSSGSRTKPESLDNLEGVGQLQARTLSDMHHDCGFAAGI